MATIIEGSLPEVLHKISSRELAVFLSVYKTTKSYKYIRIYSKDVKASTETRILLNVPEFTFRKPTNQPDSLDLKVYITETELLNRNIDHTLESEVSWKRIILRELYSYHLFNQKIHRALRSAHIGWNVPEQEIYICPRCNAVPGFRNRKHKCVIQPNKEINILPISHNSNKLKYD
jgi:hypothetical protein